MGPVAFNIAGKPAKGTGKTKIQKPETGGDGGKQEPSEQKKGRSTFQTEVRVVTDEKIFER